MKRVKDSEEKVRWGGEFKGGLNGRKALRGRVEVGRAAVDDGRLKTVEEKKEK